MEMIIAILLWMQCMLGGGTYTDSQYQSMVTNNAGTINQVLTNEQLSNSVWTAYGSLVPTVTIIENE